MLSFWLSTSISAITSSGSLKDFALFLVFASLLADFILDIAIILSLMPEILLKSWELSPQRVASKINALRELRTNKETKLG